MRIALTHNLRLSDSEDEAEFDTRETVDAIAAALERPATRSRRSRSPARPRAPWRASRPSTPTSSSTPPRARRGRVPRGVLPGAVRGARHPVHRLRRLHDRAHARQVADQARSSAQHGIDTPRGSSWRTRQRLEAARLPLPGHRQAELRGLLEGHHAGLGRARTPRGSPRWSSRAPSRATRRACSSRSTSTARTSRSRSSRASATTTACSTPVEYVDRRQSARERKYNIYDYRLKNVEPDKVVRCAARPTSRATSRRLREQLARGRPRARLRDLGRIDFRVGDDGRIYLLEVNALPSLEPGAGSSPPRRTRGCTTTAASARSSQSAAQRCGLGPASAGASRARKTEPLRVGFTYNVKRVDARRRAATTRPSTTRPRPSRDRDAIASLRSHRRAPRGHADLPRVLAEAAST